MFDKTLRSFDRAGNDNAESTRRRFPRRAQDTVVMSLHNRLYPVRDWSVCGVLFEADGQAFDRDAILPVTLKFKLAQSILEIPVQARIVRNSSRQIALEFTNVSNQTHADFNRVIDDALANPDSEDTQTG